MIYVLLLLFLDIYKPYSLNGDFVSNFLHTSKHTHIYEDQSFFLLKLKKYAIHISINKKAKKLRASEY